MKSGLIYILLLMAAVSGCKKLDQDEQSIKVYIPNAFRPDGNLNPRFGIGIYNPNKVDFEFELCIYKDDKQLLYTKNPSEHWNGKEQQIGDNMPQGIYNYTIKIKQLNNNSERTYKGELMLLR